MQEFCDYFKEWRHAKVLLATSMAWFLLYAEPLRARALHVHGLC